MSTTPTPRCFCGGGYVCSEHYLPADPTTPTPVERAAEAIDDWTGVGHASVAIAEAVLAVALDVDEIARVLAGHNIDEWTVHANLSLPFICYCGFEADDGDLDGSQDWFRAHQAAALIEHLTGVTR